MLTRKVMLHKRWLCWSQSWLDEDDATRIYVFCQRYLKLLGIAKNVEGGARKSGN